MLYWHASVDNGATGEGVCRKWSGDLPDGSASALPENAKTLHSSESGFGDDNLSYHDDSLDIQLHMIHVYDTPVAVAFVQVASAAQLKTEQAKPYPAKTTVRVTEISKRVKAVLAVNGDWFTYHNTGIVYRNGVLLRDREDTDYDGLAIDINGDFHIVRPMTDEGYAQIGTPIANSFVFGPALVIGGEVQEIVDRKVTYSSACHRPDCPLCYVLVARTDGQKDT